MRGTAACGRRPLPKRDAKIARDVVQAGLNDLLTKTSGRLQIEAVQLVGKLGVTVDREALNKVATDTTRDPHLRAALLRLLSSGPGKVDVDSVEVMPCDLSTVDKPGLVPEFNGLVAGVRDLERIGPGQCRGRSRVIAPLQSFRQSGSSGGRSGG